MRENIKIRFDNDQTGNLLFKCHLFQRTSNLYRSVFFYVWDSLYITSAITKCFELSEKCFFGRVSQDFPWRTWRICSQILLRCKQAFTFNSANGEFCQGFQLLLRLFAGCSFWFAGIIRFACNKTAANSPIFHIPRSLWKHLLFICKTDSLGKGLNVTHGLEELHYRLTKANSTIQWHGLKDQFHESYYKKYSFLLSKLTNFYDIQNSDLNFQWVNSLQST